MTSPVGVARPRPDAPPKVRGATRYAADRPRRGLLHARLVLATHAHARIVAIDVAAALETPGVVAVLSAADLPIRAKAWDRSSLPLARSEVVFAGQPIALVIAEGDAAASDAAELVDVRLEALPVVLDAEAAMDPASPLAWEERGAASDEAGSDAQTHAGVGGGEDESIDFVAHPLLIVDFGKRGADGWQESPVCFRASPVVGQLVFRKLRSLVDPRSDAPDLLFLERGLLEGHPDSPFGPGDRPDQFAFGAAARNDDGTTHTPFEDRGARVEPQPGHLDLGSVAPVTVTGKDRLYIPEVVDGLIRVDRPHRAKEERDHADPMLHG